MDFQHPLPHGLHRGPKLVSKKIIFYSLSHTRARAHTHITPRLYHTYPHLPCPLSPKMKRAYDHVKAVFRPWSGGGGGGRRHYLPDPSHPTAFRQLAG